MKFVQKIHEWHETKTGLLVFGLAELVLAYVYLSFAIDTGSLLDWFLTFVLLIGAVQNLGRFIRKVVSHG